jgi:hypothetical protein
MVRMMWSRTEPHSSFCIGYACSSYNGVKDGVCEYDTCGVYSELWTNRDDHVEAQRFGEQLHSHFSHAPGQCPPAATGAAFIVNISISIQFECHRQLAVPDEGKAPHLAHPSYMVWYGPCLQHPSVWIFLHLIGLAGDSINAEIRALTLAY